MTKSMCGSAIAPAISKASRWSVWPGFGTTSAVIMPRCVRHDQIARKILEHRRASRIDAMLVEEALIGGGLGLRDKIGRDDVENILEHFIKAERFGRAARHDRASRW